LIDVFSEKWCGFHWSKWEPLETNSHFSYLPDSPGLYRICTSDFDRMMYFGQTGRKIKTRLYELKKGISDDQMPFNDPHTATPNLWAWKKTHNFHYQCSGTSIVISDRERQGIEYNILWKYRLQTGDSPLCNFGKFHPHYTKSSNKNIKKRGNLLPKEEINPASGKSCPPLPDINEPGKSNWMNINWSDLMDLSNLHDLPSKPGLYLLLNLQEEIQYIGQTKNLIQRLRDHRNNKKLGEGKKLYRYYSFKGDVQSYQLHELENDLIGCYYNKYSSLPPYQIGIIH